MSYISDKLTSLENSVSSIGQALWLFATSIFIRTFIENFTNSNNAGFLNNPTDTFLHYPLWYAGVFISIILIIYTLTEKPLRNIVNLVSIGSFIILLPPIIDFITYGFLGHPYNFIAGDYTTLWQHFRTMLFSTNAIGIGIKIEIILATLGVGSYIWLNAKKYWKGILGGVLTYSAIFFFLSIPVHTMALYNIIAGTPTATTPENVVQFFTPTNNDLGEYSASLQALNTNTPQQKHFSQKISITFMVGIVILGAILMWRRSKRQWRALLNNIRPVRLFHWFALASIGLYFGIHRTNIPWDGVTIYFILDLIALVIAITSAWLFSVWDNDEEDITIDSVTNHNRPLIQRIFSADEWAKLKYVFLFCALISAWLAGYYIFTFLIVFMIIYHHYSRKPIRFKRILGISSLAVPANTVLCFMAGFFIAHPGSQLGSLPFTTIGVIFIVYAVIENAKNIKDIAGDSADGITTFATLTGDRTGLVFSIFAICITLGLLVLLQPPLIIIIASIIGALLCIYFLNKKPYRERSLFLVYAALLLTIILYLWI